VCCFLHSVALVDYIYFYLGKSIQCIAIVIGCNEDVNKNERNGVPRIFTVRAC